MLHKAARQGDKVALSTWKETGTYLGIGIAGLVNLFNPEYVIFTGGISGAYEFFKTPMIKVVKSRAFKRPAEIARFKMARNRNDLGVIGAARL